MSDVERIILFDSEEEFCEEYIEDVIEEINNYIGECDDVRIEMSPCDWTGKTGYKIVPMWRSKEDFRRSVLSIDGAICIIKEGDEVYGTVHSHDIPTGATLTFSKYE